MAICKAGQLDCAHAIPRLVPAGARMKGVGGKAFVGGSLGRRFLFIHNVALWRPRGGIAHEGK